MSILRFAARCAFAFIFVLSGYEVATNPGRRVEAVEAKLPIPNAELAVRAQGAGMLTLGSALALGIKPRLAALGLAGILVPTTYVGHQYWTETDEMRRVNQKVHFRKNISLMGGLLAYAFTEPEHD